MRLAVTVILFGLSLTACGGKDPGPRTAVDADGDGYKDDLDCDDGDAAVSPAAAELCDGVDNDCDGVVDGDAEDASTWYPDNDHDGYGSSMVPGQESCDDPSDTVTYSTDHTDCDDSDDQVSPAATEDCEDGLDNDCDGAKDGCTDYTGVDLGSADATFTGESAGAGAGTSVAGAGDVDGDGLDDLLVGAPEAVLSGDAVGKAYLVLGGRTGALALSAADAKLTGELDGDMAGASVAGGDVDGDGFSDVLVGASGESTIAENTGVVYALMGPVASGSLADADATLFGYGKNDMTGSSLAVLGDVNDDGSQDLLVGEPFYHGSDTVGRVYLVMGVPGGDSDLKRQDGRVEGTATSGLLGSAVSAAGDLDGDGKADLLFGAPGADSRAGVAYVALDELRGAVTAADVDLTLNGETAGDQAGAAVAAAGDQDGDGLGDVLVGAWGQDGVGTDAGAVYLVSGSARGAMGLGDAAARLDGDEAGDYAGYSLSLAGDVNADGIADVVVGAPRSAAGGEAAGVAYVLLGPIDASRSLHSADGWIIGEEATDQAGRAVACAGDVDGDGASDLIVGTPLSDGGGTDAGASWLILGAHF